MSWRAVHPTPSDPYVHVVPEDDEMTHVLRGATCCLPRVEEYDPRTGKASCNHMICHRAADRRELVEQAETILRNTEALL